VVLEKTEVAGLRLLESAYHPKVTLPKHSHASASVPLQGAITETYSKKTLHWKPLSFGFNLPDEEHTAWVPETGARFLSLLEPSWTIVLGSSLLSRCLSDHLKHNSFKNDLGQKSQ